MELTVIREVSVGHNNVVAIAVVELAALVSLDCDKN